MDTYKFAVGDRVKVVKASYSGRTGTIVSLTSHHINSYAVQIDGINYSGETVGTLMSETELAK